MFTEKEKTELINELETLQKQIEHSNMDKHEGLQYGGHYDISSFLEDITRQLIYIVDIGLQ